MAEYELRAYGRMLTHEERISAYTSAIRAAVRPGDVVVEIGTGTGVMALLACQCGAKHVYALEPSEGIVIAQQTARDNGFADRITFLRARSTQVTLPERGDVLISDLRGSTPCYSTHLVDLMDARARLLQPDARWVCASDQLHVAVIDVPDPVHQLNEQWSGARWGLNLGAALPFAANQIARHWPAAGDLLGPAQVWARLEYPTLQTPHVRGTARLEITREGTAHGLSVWFTAGLFGGASYHNAPGSKPGVYSPMLFPFERPLALCPGDTVEVNLDALFSGHDYWWNWNTVVRRPGASEPLAGFKQSTFKGQVRDRAMLAAASPAHVLEPTPLTEEMRLVLNRIDGRATQAEIAAELRARFPERFPSDDAALARVSQIRLLLE